MCQLLCEIADPLSSFTEMEQDRDRQTWLVLSTVVSSIFPSWRSRFFFKINEDIMKSKNVATAATSHMVLSPGSFTHRYQQKLNSIQLKTDVKRDPTFDITNSFIVGQYDNIQLIKKQTNETGAGSLGKQKNLVQVRTARMMMRVQNPLWAKYQRMYKHNAGVMARTYPLNDVPADCINVATMIPASDNPQKLSDKNYLELEYIFNMKFAVELVLLDGDSWKQELRGNACVLENDRLKQSQRYQKECSQKNGGCGNWNFNSFSWCRFCEKQIFKITWIKPPRWSHYVGK